MEIPTEGRGKYFTYQKNLREDELSGGVAHSHTISDVAGTNLSINADGGLNPSGGGLSGDLLGDWGYHTQFDSSGTSLATVNARMVTLR